MSVILQFAIFPTDKGASVSNFVSKAIEAVKDAGIDYQLTPMSTIIETDTLEEALQIVAKANSAIEPFADRVYISINVDIRKGDKGRMKRKVDSVKQIVGNVNL